MPHVNIKTYPRTAKEYELEYVEVVSDISLWFRSRHFEFQPDCGSSYS